MDMKKRYTFNGNIRIIDDGVNQIVFRIGLWNYNEAVLELSDQTENFKKAIREIINVMLDNKDFKLENIDQYGLNNDEREELINTIEALYTSGIICSKEEEDIKQEINKMLLGDFRYLTCEEENHKRILFIGDNSYAQDTAKELSKSMNISLDICSEDLKEKLTQIDLTSNLDALTMKSNKESIKQFLDEYSCILLCMQNVNVSLFKNLNRMCLDCKIPIITAFVDGPFINVVATDSVKNGCLECFEQRVLSRMEDHVLYHRFTNSSVKTGNFSRGGFIPLLNILTNLLICEGFLMINSGGSKFNGRVLSIFIPTLEIQVQDLLRVPFCPACGNISKAKLQDINISARNIVNNIIEDIES